MRAGLFAALIAGTWLVPATMAAQQVCETPWRLEETLRIGSIDGPDALSGVLGLGVGPDRDVYLVQAFVPRVAVFTSDGDPDRTIGRPGSGPGEFDVGPVGLGWVRDTFWVADQSAVHFYDPNGAQSREVRFGTSVPSEGSFFLPGVPLPDGTFLGRRGLRGNFAGFFLADRLPLLRLSARGEVLDTIAMVRRRPGVEIDGGYAASAFGDWWGVSDLPVALTPDARAVVLIGDVTEEGPTPAFDLLKIGIDGDTILSRSIRYRPKPVTRAERSWYADAFGHYQAMDYSSGSRDMPMDEARKERLRKEGREALDVPKHHPPVRRIVAGEDGSTWLLRELTLPDLADRWELYDAHGDLRGAVTITEGSGDRVPWHPRLKVLEASADDLWGTTVDDLDVPYVHRYHVDKTCR